MLLMSQDRQNDLSCNLAAFVKMGLICIRFSMLTIDTVDDHKQARRKECKNENVGLRGKGGRKEWFGVREGGRDRREETCNVLK